MGLDPAGDKLASDLSEGALIEAFALAFSVGAGEVRSSIALAFPKAYMNLEYNLACARLVFLAEVVRRQEDEEGRVKSQLYLRVGAGGIAAPDPEFLQLSEWGRARAAEFCNLKDPDGCPPMPAGLPCASLCLMTVIPRG